MGYILANFAACLVVGIYLGSESVTGYILYGYNPSDVDCSDGQGFHPNKYNCGQFYQCSYGNGILKSCPVGLYFNPLTNNCDWPYNVDAASCSQASQPQGGKNSTAPDILYARGVGELSLNDSNSVSSITCPDGTVPVDCACSSPGKCNGAEIVNRECKVYSMKGEDTHQQAIASCLSELTTAEFRWVDNKGLTKYPIADCPEDYQVFKCLLVNPWSDSGYVFTKMDAELNRCETDIACNSGMGCHIQAICRKTKFY